MNTAQYFGYGSLVNRATHGHPGARRATVHGWRRIWRHTGLREVAFLTVIPDPGAEIDGLIADVPQGDWSDLDLRERAYDRVPVAAADPVHIYTIPDGKHAPATTEHPVLLSYIDVVVQGYLREFGEAGVARFFQTTSGWSAPIADDRAAPRYMRHQRLSADETALVDAHLAALSVRLIPGH